MVKHYVIFSVYKSNDFHLSEQIKILLFCKKEEDSQ